MVCRHLVLDHMRSCYDKTTERIKWIAELEDEPFTLTEQYLSNYKEKFLAFFKLRRLAICNWDLYQRIHRIHSNHNQGGAVPAAPTYDCIGAIKNAFKQIGVHDVSAEDIPQILPADDMDPALDIMSEVRAYFQGKCVHS